MHEARYDSVEEKKGDNYSLCLKGEGNDPSSQRGRGRRSCVGVGAFWFEVGSHLRETHKGDE